VGGQQYDAIVSELMDSDQIVTSIFSYKVRINLSKSSFLSNSLLGLICFSFYYLLGMMTIIFWYC